MSCQKCDEMQAVAYYRVGKANVGLIGCDKHLNEVMRAVDGRKEDRPILRCFLPAPETTTPEVEGIEETHNTREVVDEYFKAWEPFEVEGDHEQYSDGIFISDIEYAKERLTSTLHHQLQKARHDWLREEIKHLQILKRTPQDCEKCHACELAMSCTTAESDRYLNQCLQTIIDRYQSELDQDKKSHQEQEVDYLLKQH